MSPTFVSLDLETTGLDPKSDEIIEIGAVRFQGQETPETFHSLVKPYRLLPYRIQVLTGITQQEVNAAPPLAVVLGELVSFLGDHPIVGQSISFDIGFLSQNGLSLSNQTYDTFELATVLLPTLSDYSLSTITESLGISFPVKHRALPDAMVTKEVFLTLLDKARRIDLSVIAEINRLTRALDWPLARLFRQVEREKLKNAFSGETGLEEVEFGVLDKEREERLSPAPEVKPLDLDGLTQMFGSEGLMAYALPGFEHRPEQVGMMQAVARALNSSQHLIVEAGTGTGKSIAYLLPAISFALGNGVPVVVSTNTINLQEQLISKDIPDLIKALQRESLPALRYTQLKGRSNYLCLRRWGRLRMSQSLSLDEVKLLMRTLIWVATTKTGDRAELSLRGEEPFIWSRICAQSDSCLGAQCSYQRRGSCFLYRARRKAESAHIIVVNHALLLSDLTTGSQVLPHYNHLIVDEAHHLEEEATEQWGFKVGERDLTSYLGRLSEMVDGEHYAGLLFELEAHLRGSSIPLATQGEMVELAQGVRHRVEGCRDRLLAFFDALWRFLDAHTDDQGEYERRLRLTAEVRSQTGWPVVALACENLNLALQDIGSGLSRLYTLLEPFSEAKILDYENLMMELSSLIYRNGELRHQIDSILSGQESERVYWASLRERGDIVTLCAAPLNVGQVLADALFAHKECVVLTSSTLSTEGHFEYIKERLGLGEASELLLGSSFNYQDLAMIYIPEDIPEPGEPGYQHAVEQVLIDLCRATQGRTLALFTSYAALRASRGAIRTPLQGEGVLVLGQGIDGSPKQLLQTFKTYPRVLLMGTSSLWEGIDVVGEALSVLVIARLPFSVPNEPVFQARSELFDNPFNHYAVPQAVLRFKQGFGRLIRSKSDRGVMLVLDRRVKTKPYGAAFLESLPPCSVRSGPARRLATEVLAWLDRKV